MNKSWKITVEGAMGIETLYYTAPGVLDAIQQLVENTYPIANIIKVELLK